MNSVLESTKSVVEDSKNVRINKTKIKEINQRFSFIQTKRWLDDLEFFQKLEPEQRLNFIFTIASQAFCFWGDPKWTIEYKGEKYDGGFGLLKVFERAIENRSPIFEAEYLVNISREDLKEIFKGNVEIPLFEERLKILREIGNGLIQRYNGNFVNIIHDANNDIIKILELIANDFPSFNDYAFYNKNKVYFYKKAQLAIADIYYKFKNQEFGNLKNIDQITACADYKIPQVLRKLGILEYSQKLAEKVDNKVLIPQGSEEEVEIRANMIWAIELMKKDLKIKIPNITAMDIDSYLWFQGQKKSPNDKPYHLTRTIFY